MRGTLVALVIGIGTVATVACSSDPSGSDVTTSGGLPGVDAGSSSGTPITPDSGGSSSGGSSGSVDSGPPDTTAPLAVADLAATALGHTVIGLTWTAPADPPGGNVSSYEVRRSTVTIANATEFAAATPVTIGSPKPQGTAEALTVAGLTPETTYYFAIRAKDAAGNTGPISNVATATTKARATLLVTEVAMLNATGKDFVELVATKAGSVRDLAVKQAQSPNGLHTFADLDVAVGDRIVVHLTNLPGPTGFAQEDTAKSKTASTETTTGAATAEAWDVYSTAEGLVGTDNVISVVDGTTIMDAVAYSDRDGDAATTVMTAFAAAKTATQWGFTADPVDATNDCATQREAVAVSSAFGNGACGKLATGIAEGKSINRRNGSTDTNSKKDWYVAVQTPGAAEGAMELPSVNAVATSSTAVELRFNQEIDGTTVAIGVFTGSGVTISAATHTEPALVTLTTTAQNGPHTIGIAAALKTIYATTIADGAPSVRFCGYEPLDGLVALVEVGPEIPNADLLELQVTRAGNIGHLAVRRDPQSNADGGTLVANFPPGLCVALNDTVVIHLQPATLPAMPNETLAKNEVPTATEASYYDGAWDIRGGSSGLPNTDAVLAVLDTKVAGAGNYVDAMAYSNADGSATAAFLVSLPYIQGKGLWLPADCGGAACTDASTPTAQGVAVSTVGVGSDAAGSSVRRSTPGSTRTAASWTVGTQSWGAAN